MNEFSEYSEEEQIKVLFFVCKAMHVENENLSEQLREANLIIQDYPRRRNIWFLVAIFTFVCGFVLRMLT
jgi:hypothetical protein